MHANIRSNVIVVGKKCRFLSQRSNLCLAKLVVTLIRKHVLSLCRFSACRQILESSLRRSEMVPEKRDYPNVSDVNDITLEKLAVINIELFNSIMN